ncbi:MAG: FRG domain-containing protein [Acidobacteriaceae bacterium]
MKHISAVSIGDVTDIVAETRKKWRLREDEEIWFRGEDQRHKETTLEPKLYRDLPKSINTAPQGLLEKEADFAEEFFRRGLELYGREASDWEWYFLMQHHSAPTRLLDWTDGAMMALHFATRGELSNSEGAYLYVLDPFQLVDDIDVLPGQKEIKKSWKIYREYRRKKGLSSPGGWPTVYLPGHHGLKAKSRKPRLPEESLVLEFPLMTRRIAAQHSRLIVLGTSRYWIHRYSEKSDAHIKRIDISKSNVRKIRNELRDAGVSESVIFPDLDGLGRELGQLWDQLKGRRQYRRTDNGPSLRARRK